MTESEAARAAVMAFTACQDCNASALDRYRRAVIAELPCYRTYKRNPIPGERSSGDCADFKQAWRLDDYDLCPTCPARDGPIDHPDT